MTSVLCLSEIRLLRAHRSLIKCSVIWGLMMCQTEIHCHKATPTQTSVDPPSYRACNHRTELSIFQVKGWTATRSSLKCQCLRYDTKSTSNRRSRTCTSPKLKIIVLQRIPWRKGRDKLTEWEKISGNHLSDKDLVSRTYNQFLQQ